jgi:hypothetical protein
MLRGAAGDHSEGVPETSTHHRRAAMITTTTAEFELRYQSFDSALCFVFPCDPQGRVDMDRLCERTRLNYLYARAMVGYELAAPAVRPATIH